jgi:hypothetical protein
MAVASSLLASTFMPAPGWMTLTTSSPINSAIDVTTSKYSSAFMPTRPSLRISPMLAIPTTTVKKMIGPIIMRINLIKPTPSGSILPAVDGATTPSTTPRRMPTMTRKYSVR